MKKFARLPKKKITIIEKKIQFSFSHPYLHLRWKSPSLIILCFRYSFSLKSINLAKSSLHISYTLMGKWFEINSRDSKIHMCIHKYSHLLLLSVTLLVMWRFLRQALFVSTRRAKVYQDYPVFI